QRPDPRRLPWTGLRDRRDRRRDGGAAPELRPGRPQRPCRQPAGDHRLSTARLCRARPLRGTPHPPTRVALARSRGAPAPPLPQGVRTPMTMPLARPAHDATDLGLAAEGVRRIDWAEREMPVLRLIRDRFER